jgi:hypothetical protein
VGTSLANSVAHEVPATVLGGDRAEKSVEESLLCVRVDGNAESFVVVEFWSGEVGRCRWRPCVQFKLS